MGGPVDLFVFNIALFSTWAKDRSGAGWLPGRLMNVNEQLIIWFKINYEKYCFLWCNDRGVNAVLRNWV